MRVRTSLLFQSRHCAAENSSLAYPASVATRLSGTPGIDITSYTLPNGQSLTTDHPRVRSFEDLVRVLKKQHPIGKAILLVRFQSMIPQNEHSYSCLSKLVNFERDKQLFDGRREWVSLFDSATKVMASREPVSSVRFRQ